MTYHELRDKVGADVAIRLVKPSAYGRTPEWEIRAGDKTVRIRSNGHYEATEDDDGLYFEAAQALLREVSLSKKRERLYGLPTWRNIRAVGRCI